MNQEKLFEKELTEFLRKKKIDKNDISITTSTTKQKGIKEIVCAICLNVIASAIWDGIKWVWTYYTHECKPPQPQPNPTPPPIPPAPACCPLCGEQLVPGKKHYCK